MVEFRVICRLVRNTNRSDSMAWSVRPTAGGLGARLAIIPPMAPSPTGNDWLAPLDDARRTSLNAICLRASALGMRVALVGGFVRDRLLGLAPDDFDLVVEGDATTLSRDLEATLGGALRVHRPFGTATWQAPDGHLFDLASARQEIYESPAALPTVSTGATLLQDLARRDFSINAMALPLSLDGADQLLDPFDGRQDLATGCVRVLHPLSYIDDPTRLFRAARYMARYGFRLDAGTAALVDSGIQHLADLSGDRIRHELALIAAEQTAPAALEVLAEQAVLGGVHPALNWSSAESSAWPAVAAASNALTPTDEIDPEDLRLASLLALILRSSRDADAGAGDAWGRALARVNPNAVVARAVMESLDADPTAPERPSAVVARLDALSDVSVLALAVVRPDWRVQAERYWREWRHVRPQTTGDDLIARGLRPGPRFRELLWTLRAALLDGSISPEQETAWLDKALTEESP